MRLAVHVEAHLALRTHRRDHRVGHRLTRHEVQVRRVGPRPTRVHRHEPTLIGSLTGHHGHVQRHRTDGGCRCGQTPLVQNRELQRGTVAATVADLVGSHTADVLTSVEHTRGRQGGERGRRRRERNAEQVDVRASSTGAPDVAGTRGHQHNALARGGVVVQVCQRTVRISRVSGGVRRNQLSRAQHRVVQEHVEFVVVVVRRDEVIVGFVSDEATVGRDPRSSCRSGRLTGGDLADEAHHRARSPVVPQVHTLGRAGVSGQQIEARVGLEGDAVAVGRDGRGVLGVDQRRRRRGAVGLHAGVGGRRHRRRADGADHQATDRSRRTDHVGRVGHERHLGAVGTDGRQITATLTTAGGERTHPHRRGGSAPKGVRVHVGAEVQVLLVEVFVGDERDLRAVTAELGRIRAVARRDVLAERGVVRNAHHADRDRSGLTELVERTVGVGVTVDHVHVGSTVGIEIVELVLRHVRHLAAGRADVRVVAVQTRATLRAVGRHAETRHGGAVGDEHIDGTVGIARDEVARQRLERRPARARRGERGGDSTGFTDTCFTDSTVGIATTGVEHQASRVGQGGRRGGRGPHRTRPERGNQSTQDEITETLLHQSSLRLMIELMGQSALFKRQ